jgi:hypothetical protein
MAVWEEQTCRDAKEVGVWEEIRVVKNTLSMAEEDTQQAKQKRRQVL